MEGSKLSPGMGNVRNVHLSTSEYSQAHDAGQARAHHQITSLARTNNQYIPLQQGRSTPRPGSLHTHILSGRRPRSRTGHASTVRIQNSLHRAPHVHGVLASSPFPVKPFSVNPESVWLEQVGTECTDGQCTDAFYNINRWGSGAYYRAPASWTRAPHIKKETPSLLSHPKIRQPCFPNHAGSMGVPPTFSATIASSRPDIA